MQHTANACDLLQSKIRDNLHKNGSSTISFPNKVRNNSDYLLFAFSYTDNSCWSLIISFNMPWQKHKSSNCWIFRFICEDRIHLNWQLAHIFAYLWNKFSSPHYAITLHISSQNVTIGSNDNNININNKIIIIIIIISSPT